MFTVSALESVFPVITLCDKHCYYLFALMNCLSIVLFKEPNNDLFTMEVFSQKVKVFGSRMELAEGFH